VTALPEGMRGRILAIAIMVIMIATVNLVIIGPLFAFYDGSGQRLQDRLDVVQRYRTAADALPRLKEEAKEWDEQAQNSNLLLTGASDPIAAASLQSTLKDLIEQGGGKLTTAQTLAAETENKFRRVGVRVAFSADLALLTAVLLGIETARPVLTVNNLEVHTAGDSADGETLEIAMDVYGFRSQ
jgi:general secretion pathway protein M